MIRYLSRAEVADRINVRPATLSRYRLPEPDAMIGAVRGWLPDTIDEWNAQRPGPGARTDLDRQPAISSSMARLIPRPARADRTLVDVCGFAP